MKPLNLKKEDWDAEKAYETAVSEKKTGSPREAFMAGRASRDAEVAELRKERDRARTKMESRPEQEFVQAVIADRNKAESALAEAQATIEAVVKAYKDGPIALAKAMYRILSAPSSTGGGDD